MSHPLIERLLVEFGYPTIDLDNHDEFVAQPGMNVVFLPGDPNTVRDATDVAVILPELVAAFEGALRPGVVTDTFGAGKQLKMRVQDWADYLDRINALLVAAPRRAPGFSIPVVGAES